MSLLIPPGWPLFVIGYLVAMVLNVRCESCPLNWQDCCTRQTLYSHSKGAKRIGNRGKWWFGRVLEGLGAPLGVHGAIFWKVLQKLGRRWAQHGRNWRQVAPKMGHDSAKVGQDGAKMVTFRSTWEVLGWFWEHFWVIWGDGLDSEKH